VRGDDRPIAKSTLNQAVKALGLDVEHFVLHDFRRTAAAHLREMTEHAQTDKSSVKTRQSASREDSSRDATEQRQIAQRWADFVDAQLDAARQSASRAG